MTVDQAARRWSRKPITIHRWLGAGLFPSATKVPGPHGPQWNIPDGTKRPRVKIGRPTLTPAERAKRLQKRMARAGKRLQKRKKR